MKRYKREMKDRVRNMPYGKEKEGKERQERTQRRKGGQGKDEIGRGGRGDERRRFEKR